MNSCWLPHYRLALKYASGFNYQHRYDITHDAWINYHRTHKEDLFDMDYQAYPSYLYRAVKWAFFRWREKRRPVEEYDLTMPGPDNPHEQLVAQDLYERLYNKMLAATYPSPSKHRDQKTREKALNILKLTCQGYTQNDIAKKLNCSRELVHQYVLKIRSMASLNPFNGSKLKVTRVIALSTWYGLKDKEDFEEEDYNEFYRLYKHKESKDGLLVKLKKDE